MKKLPIGIQNIDEILSEDYLYIDKTHLALKLIESGKHYFMSRPRRFGKSLFLSTLEAIFNAKQSLFKGYKIYNSNYQWENYPTLLFDFSRIPNTQANDFENGLKETLHKAAEVHNLTIKGSSLQMLLENLIEGLAKDQRVVVLVDEYDKPIINNLQNLAVAEKNRDHLKSFFTVLKSLDKHLKFTFVTGVSKFSQVSLFSGPNNLLDITMHTDYAHMMGYTEDEVQESFKPQIKHIAEQRNETEAFIYDEVKKWYNGYRFAKKAIPVYNPFSTLNYMHTGEPESYWYRTGTPAFLINEVKTHPKSLAPLNGTTALKNTLLDISSLDHIDLTALMFQTGYLTIQDKGAGDLFHLDFPNLEVTQAFLGSLVDCFARVDPALASSCQELLESENMSGFIDQINAQFASFPYHLFTKASEAIFHGILLALLKGMGFDAHAEHPTNQGLIDLIVEMQNTVYIFECKLDKTAENALKQIEDKKYFEKHLYQGKDIVIIGINFSSKDRNISSWTGKRFTSDFELTKIL